MAQTAKTLLVRPLASRTAAEGVPDGGKLKYAFGGEGRRVILEPLAEDWAWLDAIAGTFSDDFCAEGRRQPAEQERPAMDRLFD